MIGGQKNLARTIVGKALVSIKHKQLKSYAGAQDDEERQAIELDPIKIVHTAVKHATPVLFLIPFTRGGTTYQVAGGRVVFHAMFQILHINVQVPTPVHPKYARFMALKWFVRICRDRKIKDHMHNLLAEEFLAAALRKEALYAKFQGKCEKGHFCFVLGPSHAGQVRFAQNLRKQPRLRPLSPI